MIHRTIPPEYLFHAVGALLRAELLRQRGGTSEILGESQLNPDTSISSLTHSNSFAADSIERLALAARINQFFHLHETGIEDYLLRKHRLGEWVDIVVQAIHAGTRHISFQTSGSTGAAKICTHTLASLWQETAFLATVLQPVQKIIACALPHHIYGWLFTVMLPTYLNNPVIRAMDLSPGKLRTLLEPGDLFISFPTYWAYLADSLPDLPSGISGVTSTAPCPPELTKRLLTNGLERFIEVYGSSETGGVGYRINTIHEQPEYYTLFEYCSLHQRAEHRPIIHRIKPDGTIEEQLCMDTILQSGDRLFRPTGRLDVMVQVAGINVSPEAVAKKLCTNPWIKEASVRQMNSDNHGRLKAFFVLREPYLPEPELRQTIQRWIHEHLTTPEQPVTISFGNTLPRNSLGKLTDWS